ncbi:MAG: hypothetical protein HC896_08205 [Bacteroidales bacterium]|nr:hypothetical protein [Bacteroidales bacterium]
MESGESGGETPEIKEVATPAGLTATKDGCDGSILVTWDYNGDVEPTKFILKANGNTIAEPNGDVREYLHQNVGNYQTVEYQITAEGSYNGVNSSRTSSKAEGKTTGAPSQPSSFNASPRVIMCF